jgi:hypothetical protein
VRWTPARDERLGFVNDPIAGLDQGERAALRAAIGEIDERIAGLLSLGAATGYAERAMSLAGSWARLTRLLALEPEPLLRECPHCKLSVMRTATRCIHCWKRSEPPPPHS